MKKIACFTQEKLKSLLPYTIVYQSSCKNDFFNWLKTNELKDILVLLLIDEDNEFLPMIKNIGQSNIIFVYSSSCSTIFQKSCLSFGAHDCFREAFNSDIFLHRISRIKNNSQSLNKFIDELNIMIADEEDTKTLPMEIEAKLLLLNKRQIEIIKAMGKGLERHEIAKHRGCSTKTIDNEFGKIKKLLGFASTTDLYQFARKCFV